MFDIYSFQRNALKLLSFYFNPVKVVHKTTNNGIDVGKGKTFYRVIGS